MKKLAVSGIRYFMRHKTELSIIRILAGFGIAFGLFVATSTRYGSPTVTRADTVSSTLTPETFAAGDFKIERHGDYSDLVADRHIYYAAGGKSALDCITVNPAGGATVQTLPPPAKSVMWNGLKCGLTVAKGGDSPESPIWAQVTVVNDGDNDVGVGAGCVADLAIGVWALSIKDAAGKDVARTPLGQQLFTWLTPCAAAWRVVVPAHKAQTIIFNLRELFDLSTKGTFTVDFTPRFGSGGPSTPVTFKVG